MAKKQAEIAIDEQSEQTCLQFWRCKILVKYFCFSMGSRFSINLSQCSANALVQTIFKQFHLEYLIQVFIVKNDKQSESQPSSQHYVLIFWSTQHNIFNINIFK